MEREEKVKLVTDEKFGKRKVFVTVTRCLLDQERNYHSLRQVQGSGSGTDHSE